MKTCSTQYLSSRCDGEIDCIEDGGSDEENCSLVLIDDSYLKTFPAPPLVTKKNPIYVSVDVIKILNINEVDAVISVQFQLDLTWVDRRVKFRNLKEETYQNTINMTEAETIWYPVAVFYNTKKKDASSVNPP